MTTELEMKTNLMPNQEVSAMATPAASPDNPGPEQLFAVVNANGTLARGLFAVSSANLGTGFYEVIFSRDVTRGAYIATIGSSATSGIEQTGEITVVGRVGNPNGVFITTTDSAGNFQNRGFHLAVLCPQAFAS